MCGNKNSAKGRSFIAMEWIKRLSSLAQTDIWFHNLLSTGSTGTGSVLQKAALQDKAALSVHVHGEELLYR